MFIDLPLTRWSSWDKSLSLLTPPEHPTGLASKGVHLPIAVMAIRQDFYKVLSEGPGYLLQRLENLL